MWPPHRVIRPRQLGVSSIKMGSYYNVVSVELGNTTTKCILMSTNLETAEIFQIEKEVCFTRDVRAPREGEEVFGSTLIGIELTRESIVELISNLLLSVMKRARFDLHTDLHFVVRSTGVTAGFAEPEEVGALVKALADGCIAAGIPPRKMTASLTPDNLPPGLHDFTWLKRVHFDGAVASNLPPANTEVVANEMEGELVTAGIKGAVKGRDIDFRNPVMTLDFGTTLAGRVTDNGFPYAKTIGSFAGLAGAIPDAIVRGTVLVDESYGCVMDLEFRGSYAKEKPETDDIEEILKLIKVEKVSPRVKRFGTVPVNTEAANESNVILIGVDAGDNGSNLPMLEDLGASLYEKGGSSLLLSTIDHVQYIIVQEIVNIVQSEGLILDNTSLGLTGRAITTGTKPHLIATKLQLSNSTNWIDSHQLVFVEDGLAMGAAVAARCMNSMGTRGRPMGGRKGDGCIMHEREKLQSS